MLVKLYFSDGVFSLYKYENTLKRSHICLVLWWYSYTYYSTYFTMTNSTAMIFVSISVWCSLYSSNYNHYDKQSGKLWHVYYILYHPHEWRGLYCILLPIITLWIQTCSPHYMERKKYFFLRTCSMWNKYFCIFLLNLVILFYFVVQYIYSEFCLLCITSVKGQEDWYLVYIPNFF